MTLLRTRFPARRILLLGGLSLAVAAGIWLLRETGAALHPEAIRAALAGLGPWGPLALIVALAATLVAPVVPATLLQVGAGLAFGPPLGLLYAALADLLGASAGFWLARHWGRGLLDRRLTSERRAQLTRLAARMNWRSVMLLRLLPGPAYPLVSFAAGYSPISFRSYILASLAGVLPALALLVLAGDLVTRTPLLAFALVAALVTALALAGRLLHLQDAR
ncbi:MAG TPA: VTT domain-containing protein [Roseiflexaceae bacterium]|nr:VTT domain-containing protein [Roseiflexaceae bacterium]